MNARAASTTLLLAALTSPAFADGDRFDLALGIGSVFSRDYHAVLEERFEVVEGGQGWGVVELGLSYRATPRLRIEPGVDYLVSIGEVTFGSDFTNSILLSGVGATYALGQEARGWYLGVEAFRVSPESDLPGLEFKSDGVGTGAHLGYAFGTMALELGVRRIPVEVRSARRTESRDFGGFSLCFSVRL